MNFLKKIGGKLAVAGATLGAVLTGVSAHAEDFDASSTQSILTTALAVPKSTLAWGIPIILTIVLGIWVIFWLVGKLRKHTK
jgi:hypothetical protein